MTSIKFNNSIKCDHCGGRIPENEEQCTECQNSIFAAPEDLNEEQRSRAEVKREARILDEAKAMVASINC